MEDLKLPLVMTALWTHGILSVRMICLKYVALHVGHMTGQNEMKECFRPVTQYPAEICAWTIMVCKKNCNGDLVILQATDTTEALRLKPSRLFVIRRGKIISSEEPKSSNVLINGETYKVSFQKDFHGHKYNFFSWTEHFLQLNKYLAMSKTTHG